MNKKAIIACILTVFLLAGILYILPYVTIYRIIAAFEAKDTEKLSILVDFPQIRINLKHFIGTRLQATPAEQKPDAWGQIQKSLTTRIIASAVDDMITPEGFASFMRQRLEAQIDDKGGSSQTKPAAWSLFVAFTRHADFSYTSSSEFIVAFKESATGQIKLVLRRNGTTWRLTNIEI